MTARKAVSVYKSLSQNIFENLSFEDWIFTQTDLSSSKVLFIWRNAPCVVIGRHQNPWLEANINDLRKHDVPVARRRSGGGTVYHDLGNVNFTFFGSRADYDRKRNIGLVTGSLWKQWGIHLQINKRDDILHNGHKVSGSAAKLTRKSSLHHFTLLLRTDTYQLQHYLSRKKLNLTNQSATTSVTSSVTNLGTSKLGMDFDSLCAVVAKEMWLVNKVPFPLQKIALVDPAHDQRFDGIKEMKSELQKWEWVYGKTPKFVLEETLLLGGVHSVSLSLHIVQGHIEHCSIRGGCLEEREVERIQNVLIGTRFWPVDIAAKKSAISNDYLNPLSWELLEQIELLP